MNLKRKENLNYEDIPLYSFFHENTKINNLSSTPQSVGKIHFKSYPRFEKTPLIKDFKKNDSTLFETIENSGQTRTLERKTISLEEISTLMFLSGGISSSNEEREDSASWRPYPPIVGTYPLELYPIVLRSDQIKPGIYHYNVKIHALESMLEGDFTNQLIQATGKEEIQNGSFAILISAIFQVAEVGDGDRGYRYALLEAGHLAQNIRLVATSLGLDSRSTARFSDTALNRLLDLDGTGEAVLLFAFFGRKKEEESLGKRVGRLFR